MSSNFFAVVPRILFDGWTKQGFTKLQDKNEVNSLAKSLINAANQYKFDGYVLEVWSQVVQVLPFKGVVGFIKELGRSKYGV